METSYFIVGVVAVIAIVIVVFVIRRNQKDQKAFENEIIQSELRPEKHNDEEAEI